MKKVVICTLVMIVITVFGGCMQSPSSGADEDTNGTSPASGNSNEVTVYPISPGNGHLVANYRSIDDLIKDSPIVVTGTVDSVNNEFVVMEVPFALTKFKIEASIRGDVSGTINILQTKMAEDPFIKKGEKLMLFLQKYVGPVADDAYVIKGLYLGQYTIVGTALVKIPENRLAGSEALENFQTFIAKISETGYSPTNNQITH